MDIQIIIVELKEDFIFRYGLDSEKEINKGFCVEFAEEFSEIVGGEQLSNDDFVESFSWEGDGSDEWEEEALRSYNSFVENQIKAEDLNSKIKSYHS